MIGNDLSRRNGRCRLWCWLTLVAVVTGLLSGSASWAQDEAKPEVKPAETKPDAPADKAAGKESPIEKLIYLPYRSLKEVFEQQGSTVFMPYAEYLKQFGKPKASEKPAVEAVITEAQYVGRVDKSLLRVNAKLTVKVLGQPWVEVPVKFGAAAVGKLTSNKEGDVLLKGTGNGSYALLFGSTGEHQVELELAAPIQTSPDGRRADFEVPPVAVTTFELAVPEADQTVELTPKMVALPVEAQGKETRVKANLGSTTTISASWHPRTSSKPEMDLLAAVTNLQRVTFRDGLVHTDAWLSYEVLRGEMTEVSIAVPVGQRVLGVTSTDAKVRSWKAEPGAKHQTVKVEFLNPATGRVSLEVHTEREFTADPVPVLGKSEDGTILGVHAVQAVRESGQIVVVGSPDLTLSFSQVAGLSRIDDAEVDAKLKQPGAVAYKFYSTNTALSVVAKSAEPRLVVNGSSYQFEIHDDEIRLNATLPYQVDRAGVFELKFALPDHLLVDEVHCQNAQGQELVREFHIEGENPRVLRVPLSNRTAAADHLVVQLRAHLKFEEATEMVELTMPLPEPQGLERETGNVVVSAAESVEVITDSTGVAGAQPLPLNAGAAQVAAGLRVASMYSFNRRPVTIPVKTVRKPTRLTATIATTVNVKEETTEVVSELKYLVEYAGLDTFRFSVPESVAGDLQIVSLESAPLPSIKQKVKADKAEDGWITWTITLQREITGPYRFRLSYDMKPKELGEGGKPEDRAKQSVVQVVRVLGLDGTDAKKREVALSSVTGEIAIDKARVLAIDAEKLDDGVEAIDVRELSLLPKTGAQAYRYFKQPAAVKIEARKYEIQEVVETVVMRGLVEVVSRKDTLAAYRCRYWLKSSERQRLRLDLPKGADVLGVFVDGKQVSPERNTALRPDEEKDLWDSYFINVSRTKPSDEPFSLGIQMQVTVGGQRVPFESNGGSLMLRLPQVGGLNAVGVATQQLQTVVWVPERYDIVGEPEKFVSESKLTLFDALFVKKYRPTDSFDCDSWVNVPVAGIIDFPTEGNRYRYSNLGGAESITITWASRSFYRWLLSGSLVVFALLLRRISWENKLLLLLIGLTAASLFGLSHPGWVAEIVGVARLGIAMLLGIWILDGLFSLRLNSAIVVPPHPATETRVRLATGTNVPAAVPPPGVFDDFSKPKK